jgi:serine/threonine protein kinase
MDANASLDYYQIIGNKYKLIKLIGKGCYGLVYCGENIRTGELVAIKVESVSSATGLLKHETKIYQYLNTCLKHDIISQGIPSVKWFGRDTDNYYMVIDMLGESLEAIKERKGPFSLRTVLQIGIQAVKRLKLLYECGFVHRDIKPGNFLLGPKGKSHLLYLIDFGFCKPWKNNSTKKRTSIIGTPNFISVSVHNLNEPIPKDDLESVGYVLLYFYLDKLLWDNPSLTLQEIMKMKLDLIERRKVWEKKIPPILLNFIASVKETNEFSPDIYVNLIQLLNQELTLSL